MNRKRLITAAVGALTAVAIAVGVAYATIPGPGNIYSACMLKSVGTIRLIDKSLPATNLMSHCTDKETEVSWNQAGQPGPPGPKGDMGAAGPKGEKGDSGLGLSSLDDLAGIPCHTPNFQGVVEISSTPVSVKSASIVVRCTVPNTAVLTVELLTPPDIREGAGRVTGGPVDCALIWTTSRQVCAYAVPLGSELTLTATPVSPPFEGVESSFDYWTVNGTDCVKSTTCTFTITGDVTVVAQFSAKPVTS
jgi:hypothetical protein